MEIAADALLEPTHCSVPPLGDDLHAQFAWASQQNQNCLLHAAMQQAERQHEMAAALLAEARERGIPLSTEEWASLFRCPANITGASMDAYRAAYIEAWRHFGKCRVWNGKDDQVCASRAARGASQRTTAERVCCVLVRSAHFDLLEARP